MCSGLVQFGHLFPEHAHLVQHGFSIGAVDNIVEMLLHPLQFLTEGISTLHVETWYLNVGHFNIVDLGRMVVCAMSS